MIASRFRSPVQVEFSTDAARHLPCVRVAGRLLAVASFACAMIAVCCSVAVAAMPQASVEAPTGISTGEAVLHGTVDAGGEATSYQFEYGTTTSYGADVPVPAAQVGAGEESAAVTVHIVGLAPGTTYHFRLVVNNATGTGESEDAIFSSDPTPVSGSGCPNEARREEQGSTYLPDCRAYEMVSPLDKNGTDVNGQSNTSLLSASGERAAFQAPAGFGEVAGSGGAGYVDYVATRKAGEGWTSHGITPRPTAEDFQLVVGATAIPWLSDSLGRALVSAYDLPEATNDLPHNENLYEEDTTTGALETLTTPIGVEPFSYELLFAFGAALRASSADLGVVTFEGRAKLLAGLPSGQKLYEWNHGHLEIAGVLPDGTLPAGGSTAPGNEQGYNYKGAPKDAVSRDGSDVLFMSPANGSKPAQLYLRKNSTETVWVSQSEASTPNPEPRGIEYLDMSSDGSKVLFASTEPLTAADPGGEGSGIYVYTDGPSPESEENLDFIARVKPYQAPTGGPIYKPSEEYIGMSEDAKRIYFFTAATSGLPQTGVYIWDEGAIHFIAATEAPLGTGASHLNPALRSLAEISADGERLAFISPAQLAGAQLGTGPGGKPLPAMYVYDEPAGSLRCVSCLPSGAPTTSEAEVAPEATDLPGGVTIQSQIRFVSTNGKYVFFNTSDALVPQDTNKLADAYEYNTETGKIALLSSGTGDYGSWFANTNSDGSNVLIISRDSYLAQDTDSLVDLYDVRVDGGFLQPKPASSGCLGDECQGEPSRAPVFQTANGFAGEGNLAPAKPRLKRHQHRRRKQKIRRRKLRRALTACQRTHRHNREKRRACKRRARRRYRAHAPLAHQRGRNANSKATRRARRR